MKQLLKKVLILLSASIALASCQNKSETETVYINPVIHGELADPSIIRIGETYYATGTSSEWAPFYPVYTSTDLLNWKQTGHIFNQKPEWTSNSFWAPELYYHNNKVYCYYTARRASDNVSYIGVATANTPTEEFTDHGIIIEYGTEAIDAFVYDDNGQLYITWKAYGLDKRPIEIIGSKLSADGLRLEGEPFTLLVDDERIGMEGQYHFKQGDYYYIVYSSRGCCGPRSDYDVCVARAENFEGPYEKYEGNPILQGGEDFLSCGHGTAVTTPDGRMYYMCHAYLNGEGFYQGRQAILQEMAVNDEDWVYFPAGTEAQIVQTFHGNVALAETNNDIQSPYDWWTWNYPYADVKISQHGEKVILTGTPKDGNKYGSVACVRPVSPYYTYETKVSKTNGSFKGLTMYGDNNNLVALGMEGNSVKLKTVFESKENVMVDYPVDTDEFYFKIEVTQGCMLKFWVSFDNELWQELNKQPMNWKSLVRWDRVSRPGLIHIGKKEEPAEFDYFKLQNL